RTVGASAGRLTSLTAGEVVSLTVDARSVGSISAVGNAYAGLFGNVSSTTLTLRGNAGGTTAQALGSLTAQRQIGILNLTTMAGNVGSITAGRNLSTAIVVLLGASAGDLGTIQAANWSNVQLTARSVQTAKAVIAPLTTPDSSFLQGDITSSIILAYLDN